MESVGAVVFIGWNVVLVAVQRKGAVLDAVRVAADHGAEVGVRGLGVVQVLPRVVIAHDDVLQLAVAVRDQQRGQSRAVGDHGGGDVFGADGVGLEGIGVVVFGGIERAAGLRQNGHSAEHGGETMLNMHSGQEKGGRQERT